MNEKYIEQIGLVFKNTYSIHEHSPKSIGKLIMNLVKYFEQEELRDAREQVNQAQWDEARIDTIGSNGNEGLHYDSVSDA